MCNIIDPKLATGSYAKYFKKLNSTTEEVDQGKGTSTSGAGGVGQPAAGLSTSTTSNGSHYSLQNGNGHTTDAGGGSGMNGAGSGGTSPTSSGTELMIPVPWGHVAAKTFGDPTTGHPILAVHGWMDNAGTFDGLLPLLSKNYYVVAVDLPGHGLSSHLPKGVPYHFTDFIIALRRIVNHLKWTKFSWIGHSMGAGLGALYASTFPSHVEHLVMLDLAKPITGESGADYGSKISLAIDQFLALEEKITPVPPVYPYEEAVQRLITATGGSLTAEAAQTLMIRGAKKTPDSKWYFTRDLRLRSPSILRFSHEQCFTILKQIRSNTLVIKATDAPWFEPEEICQRALDIYKTHCKSYKFVEVEGNHFVHLNEPEKLAGIINSFINITNTTTEHQPTTPKSNL